MDVDLNKPVENPELVAAMEDLQQGLDSVTQESFLEQLSASRFLMLLEPGFQAPEPDEDGAVTLPVGTTISMPMLNNREGQPLHMAFTDWAALRAYRDQPGQQTLVLRAQDLPEMVLRPDSGCAGVVLNPGTHNMLLPRQLLANISSRANPVTVRKETPVVVGEPDDFPQPLADAVCEAVKPLRAVRRAWLLLMEKEEERSYLIVVDYTGEREPVSQAVGRAAAPYLPPGMFVDVISFADSFGQEAAGDKKPFYKRGLLSRFR